MVAHEGGTNMEDEMMRDTAIRNLRDAQERVTLVMAAAYRLDLDPWLRELEDIHNRLAVVEERFKLWSSDARV